MTLVVISPHLDDAVLSMGGGIARHPDVIVVTLLAGFPPQWTWPTPFDNASGFQNSRLAVQARRVEDQRATAELGARWSHVGFLDGQYGLPANERAMVQVVRHLTRDADVAVPLGLAHPDHRLVARVCRAAFTAEPGRPLLVYADLPAAKISRGHVRGARRGWERAGYELTEWRWPVDLAAKNRARRCYTSQLRFPELAWANLTEERGWITCAPA